jgi:RNA polymerase sigma-70 factor (ECF subfamily)
MGPSTFLTAWSDVLSGTNGAEALRSSGYERYHRDRTDAHSMPQVPQTDSATQSLETTVDLIVRARQGDQRASELLVERCVPSLRRWARGRLPADARDLSDTQDLVQEAVLHTLQRLSSFRPTHRGAVQAYLRQAIVNRMRDEIRRARAHPVAQDLADEPVDSAPCPLEQAIGREGIERYEAALQRLNAADREAIIARIELQQSYAEVAVALDKPTADAARVAVTRALAHLVKAMDDER